MLDNKTVIFVVISLLFVAVAHSSASVIPVGLPAFPSDSTFISFTGLTDGTEVNGLIVNPAAFSYLIGGSPTNGEVLTGQGPGVTNNINPPAIISAGDASGTLIISLASPVNFFGYGYAVLATQAVNDATTLSILNGNSVLLSISYSASPDPTFAGGFAGLESTDPFDKVAISFNSSSVPAFAIDNILFAAEVVPEPRMTWILLITSVFFIALTRHRRRSTAFRHRAPIELKDR